MSLVRLFLLRAKGAWTLFVRSIQAWRRRSPLNSRAREPAQPWVDRDGDDSMPACCFFSTSTDRLIEHHDLLADRSSRCRCDFGSLDAMHLALKNQACATQKYLHKQHTKAGRQSGSSSLIGLRLLPD